MLGSCVIRAVRVCVLRGVYVLMRMGFAHVWGCSFLLRTIVALCEGIVLCAVFPRGRRHQRRRPRRGCRAHRPNAAGRRLREPLLLRLSGSFSVAAVVPSRRCRSIVSVSAPIRMRAAAPHVRWRVPPAFVFCYSFTRRFRGFIRRICLIICACSCHVAPAGAF